MWTRDEQLLLHAIDTNSIKGRWQVALNLSERLLALIGNDPRKAAYVLGCKIAVALGHLKSPKAKEAFDKAFQQAEAMGETAIAAYILNDSANIMEDILAAVVVTQAMEMLQKIERSPGTPDHARHLLADYAYFQANLGRIQTRTGDAKALHNLVNGREDLQRFAYGCFPYYKTAYLVALGWELQFYKAAPGMRLAYVRHLGRMVAEAYRQGRLGALLWRRFQGGK